jgi:hypothetical protein
MSANRWLCKVCRKWGLGGPDGWAKHWTADHVHSGRYAAHLSFGFTGDYSDGFERRGDRVATPAIAEAMR